jgi:cytidine deaminase
LGSSDRRLSVTLVDVRPGKEEEFLVVATRFEALLIRKEYGRAETIRDEANPHRFYAVRYWSDISAAERCHGDPEVQLLTAQLYQLARVTHVVNGIRRQETTKLLTGDRRARVEADRRTGFDRRQHNLGRSAGDQRNGVERRLGPRRLRDRGGEGSIDLVAAARRARENADAAFSHFKVGAALETADGTVVAGCNIENATYGLTICAERVAMFKALSDGHRAFTRIAIVADTDSPTPPCGACRQILWEFTGDIPVVMATVGGATKRRRLSELFPEPFEF